MTGTYFNWKPMALGLTGAVLISVAWTPPSWAQSAPSYGQVFPQTATLNLTPAQQDQLTQIAQDTQAQLRTILTPEQQQQLQAALDQGQSLRDAIRSLGLTPQQQAQIRATLQNTVPQVQAVLTPEQISQIQSQRGGFRRPGF